MPCAHSRPCASSIRACVVATRRPGCTIEPVQRTVPVSAVSARHISLRLEATVRLAELLTHLYVLLPVLDQVLGMTGAQIRTHLEITGLVVDDWQRERTDRVQIREIAA